MKEITFFPTLHEYRSYIYDEIVKTNAFRYDPFYRGLIDFIIDHRSPLFFNANEDFEFSHFTQYFNFVLLRNNVYENDFIRDMFFMHDFVHMMFDNPLNVHGYTFEYFCEIVNNNEWVASNETEMLTYYRIPEMRSKSFSYTTLYDLLQNAGATKQPSPESLLKLRKSIMFDNADGGLGDHPDAEKVFSFLRKFKENNKLWCELWYKNFPKISKSYAERRLCLPLLSYEEILLKYQTLNSEERYQKNTLLNIRTALEMVGETDLPETFAECADAVKRLENKIIMADVAKEFHQLYAKNKNK